MPGKLLYVVLLRAFVCFRRMSYACLDYNTSSSSTRAVLLRFSLLSSEAPAGSKKGKRNAVSVFLPNYLLFSFFCKKKYLISIFRSFINVHFYFKFYKNGGIQKRKAWSFQLRMNYFCKLNVELPRALQSPITFFIHAVQGNSYPHTAGRLSAYSSAAVDTKY